MDKFIDKCRRKHIKVSESENHSEESDLEPGDSNALHKLSRISQNIKEELDTLQKAQHKARNHRRMSDDRMSKFRLPSV